MIEEVVTEEGAVSQREPGDLTVVLIDDSDVVRQRLHALLKGVDGVAVVGHASSVETGLKVIESTRPQFLILDIMMPDESGLDLLEKLNGKKDRPRTIVLTNYPYTAFRKKASELGAEHFLAKSTEFARIPEILKEMAGSEGDH